MDKTEPTGLVINACRYRLLEFVSSVGDIVTTVDTVVKGCDIVLSLAWRLAICGGDHTFSCV